MDVSIIAEGIEQQASPIPWSGHGCDTVVVGVGLWTTVRLSTCSYRVVAKTGQDDWESWHPDDLNGSTNAICDTRETTGCGDSRSSLLIKVGALAFHLDDKRFVDGALQAESTHLLQVSNGDRIEEDVNDIGVVPNAFRRQNIALQVPNGEVVFRSIIGRGIPSDFQTIDAVVEQPITSEQWSTVGIEIQNAIDFARLTS